MSSPAKTPRKVAVVGAAGGIGQPLALLLKMNDDIGQLSLSDIAAVTPGVAADLSHMNTRAKVVGFAGADKMAAALEKADVIIVPAGVPRKPGMTRDDLFTVNAGIVANIAKITAEVAPNACLLIISNPVNSTVPIAAEILKRAGKYNPNKLFGVTTLDVVRANTFVAENQNLDIRKLNVPVLGGHAGKTILPLLSQVPGAKFSQKDKEELTRRIQFGGDEVVTAKAGGGSATLSMAYAGALFADWVLRGLNGEKNLVACSYVESNVVPGLSYFAQPVELGVNGIEKLRALPEMDEFEKKGLEAAIPELKDSIAKGIAFAHAWKPQA